MAPTEYTRIVLEERPKDVIEPTTFRLEVVPYKLSPASDEVVVHIDYVSIDPAMRGWLNDSRSYIPPVQIGETMRAIGLGKVVEAGSESKFKVGDLVRGMIGEHLPPHIECQVCK